MLCPHCKIDMQKETVHGTEIWVCRNDSCIVYLRSGKEQRMACTLDSKEINFTSTKSKIQPLY